MQSGAGSLEAAELVRDAVFLSFLWGHLPPARVGAITAMHPPSFMGNCTDDSCLHPQHCKGNRLLKSSTCQLLMHLPHHKEEAQWGHKAPQPLLLPATMLPLLGHYLTWALPRLLEEVGMQ